MQATSELFQSDWLIWVDAGLSRHVDHFGNLPWPNVRALSELQPTSIYVNSWDGYGDAKDAWSVWCKNPRASFQENRNLLSGTVIFSSKEALLRVLPLWTAVFEKMAQLKTPWNNEQVVFSLLGCTYPDLVGVFDKRSVAALWLEMHNNHSVDVVRVPEEESSQTAMCEPWVTLEN